MEADFLYVKMPVDQYGTLQWGSFEQIEEAGYSHATALVAQWKNDKVLPAHLLEGSSSPEKEPTQFKSLRDLNAFTSAAKRCVGVSHGAHQRHPCQTQTH
jgi:hypothetical protein